MALSHWVSGTKEDLNIAILALIAPIADAVDFRLLSRKPGTSQRDARARLASREAKFRHD